MWDIETHHTCETHISTLTIYVTQISTTLTLDVGHTRVTLNHTWDTHINTHVWNISTGTIHVRYTTTHMWGTPHSTFMWDTHTSNSPYRWDAQIHTTHLGHTCFNTRCSCGTQTSTLPVHVERTSQHLQYIWDAFISILTIHMGQTYQHLQYMWGTLVSGLTTHTRHTHMMNAHHTKFGLRVAEGSVIQDKRAEKKSPRTIIIIWMTRGEGWWLRILKSCSSSQSRAEVAVFASAGCVTIPCNTTHHRQSHIGGRWMRGTSTIWPLGCWTAAWVTGMCCRCCTCWTKCWGMAAPAGLPIAMCAGIITCCPVTVQQAQLQLQPQPHSHNYSLY